MTVFKVVITHIICLRCEYDI